MTDILDIHGARYADMVAAGAARLRAQAQYINDLNVFPIPDGDTGENMLLTVMGGVDAAAGTDAVEAVGVTARRVSDGMLLSARGNSGVILSQFFAGIARGLDGTETADAADLGRACREGVAQAYRAVMQPTEGTILTVMREATEAACAARAATPLAFFDAFLTEARASLARTPELLPVLRQAGVVDSGAAGLICILEGMRCALAGEEIGGQEAMPAPQAAAPALDLDAFDENSVLEFGYCTELLLRLQTAKVDLDRFDERVITDFLHTVGDSIVTVRQGSIVKLHVHTMTPDRVLAYCRQYGEFLKVKIENMSLQHNSTVAETAATGGEEAAPRAERRRYGVVAVASGEGIRDLFLDRGADVIVDGGQSMNPSAEDFLRAFEEVNAETVFVLPNNGNIVLTARQAAGMYAASDVRVIESRTVGAGYAALSMLDTGVGDPDAIVAALTEAMQGVVTAEISRCVRDACLDGRQMHVGDYIGFVGKELMAVDADRYAAVCATVARLDLANYDICILICGRETTDEEARRIEATLSARWRGKEIYLINGMQDVYDYILILE